MLEVDRDLAHKVWGSLDAGKSPYRIEQDVFTSSRTACRFKSALDGYRANKSVEAIARATGWKAPRVKLVRRWYHEYETDRGQLGQDTAVR